MNESLSIDGIEVSFEPVAEGLFRVLAEGAEIGRIELVNSSRELVAFRPGGEPLKRPSRWGGEITARFGSREVAARALLQAGSDSSADVEGNGGRMPDEERDR